MGRLLTMLSVGLIGSASLLLASESWAQEEIGLVAGSFHATCAPTPGKGCPSLLVTGQFIAPTPGYTLTVKEIEPQKVATILELELTAEPPGGVVPQVLTTVPVEYSDPDFSGSPYAVSIKYDDQQVVVGLMVAQAVQPLP